MSDFESTIKVSSPDPPINKSLPLPPLRVLFEELPVIVSFPGPLIAFSIIVPDEITRFPVRPAIFDENRALELLSVDRKSIL